MSKLGSSITPGNAFGGSRALPPLTKGGARGLECNALIALKNLKHMHFMKLKTPAQGADTF
jgi:hypothetical protein